MCKVAAGASILPDCSSWEYIQLSNNEAESVVYDDWDSVNPGKKGAEQSERKGQHTQLASGQYAMHTKEKI